MFTFYTALTAGLLFFGIFLVMPIIFFVLVGFVGKGFSLSVQRNSLLGRLFNKQ